MDASQFREAAHAAVEDVISYFNNLSSYPPSSQVQPGYLRPQLPISAPTHPEHHSSILTDIKAKIIPGLTHWQSPRFMAFFPSTVTYPSILGELFSAAFNAPAFNWICSPASTELEKIVLDWMARMLGLDDVFLSTGEGGGVIQGSASEAVLTAMVAARERFVRGKLEAAGFLPEAEDETEAKKLAREDKAAEIRGKLVALGSAQAHSSTQKGANILGVRFRKVAATRASGFVITGVALRTRIEELKAQGLEPFFVTATLGTTNTCAVDDFEGIVITKRMFPDLWVHVDAAYAGSALVCPEYRALAKSQHLHEFESVNMNMHKWMLVNFDASCMWVRHRHLLTAAFSITPAYLSNTATQSDLATDYRDWGIPLGRRFRALKIWFVLRSYGVEAIQGLIREHVRLGEVFAGLVRSERGQQAGLEIISGPAFALTVFRCLAHEPAAQIANGIEPTSIAGAEMNNLTNGHAETHPSDHKPNDDKLNDEHKSNNPQPNGHPLTPHKPKPPTTNNESKSNALTRTVYELINHRADFYLTSTVVDGIYCIRVVSASERAEEKWVRACFERIVEAVGDVRAGRAGI
ncbi:MAG: hypothetical protein M1828_005247 [Chrysothrix sp. TS-e1954]|nr:MAG: hypothetical protein M1828_005247 [Chrysothrix sp. TS-e1954]